MAISRPYTDTTARERTGKPRSRPGGPRPSRSAAARDAWVERFTTGPGSGSHMPLDTGMHWEWRNPLNIIPVAILLLIMAALVAAIV